MSARDLLTPKEAAEHLRLPVRQLQQWRYLGKGPPYYRLGRAIRYPPAELDAWLDAQRVQPEDEP